MMSQLTGGEGVNFDLREFNWLGSSYDDPNVCIVRTESPVTTFEDMVGRAMPIAVGGTGPGSNTYDAPRVLAAATGASLRAVAGYPTTNDVRIGVERGEIQGMCLGWESVQSASGPWTGRWVRAGVHPKRCRVARRPAGRAAGAGVCAR